MGPNRYFDEDEPPFRRYSARGLGFPLSHDRDLPPAPVHISYDGRRGHRASFQEPQKNAASSDQEPSARPRSRIPVACGRCRKRKIRCSGDNGGPCSNCKSAGNDQCQFLRVSSLEAPLKIDSSIPEFFDAGSVAARAACRMVLHGPSYMAAGHPPPPVGYEPYPCRNNSLPTYQPYPGKQYFSSAPTFHDYDESVDYGLQTTPYSLMSSEHLQATSPSPNYGPSEQIRGWAPNSQHPKSNTLFIEQDQPLYNHNQLSYHPGGNFPLRNPLVTDSKGLGVPGIPTLPAPITGNSRILPNPAVNRPGQVGLFLRSNDEMIPMPSNYPSYSNYMTANMLNGARAANHSSVSENGYSIPMSSASPESIASSQICNVGDNNLSLSQHHNEIYSPNDGLHYHTSRPASESSYNHSNGSRRGSQNSRTTNNDGSLPSHQEGNLSNGQHYVPYHSSSSSYPTPPMNIPASAPTHPRSSVLPA